MSQFEKSQYMDDSTAIVNSDANDCEMEELELTKKTTVENEIIKNMSDGDYALLLNNSSDSEEGSEFEKNGEPKEAIDNLKTSDAPILNGFENDEIISADNNSSNNESTRSKDKITKKNENGLPLNKQNEYRDSDSWTEEDESDSPSSSSDSEIEFDPIKRSSGVIVNCIKTRGEMGIEDLLPIEYLTISVKEKELRKIGTIHAIVDKLVVIQALNDQKPLDQDSVLFLAFDKPLGRIFETFGPVTSPFYSVLFNKPEDIVEKGVIKGADVFFAPDKADCTSYVFVDALKQQKGSDASWKDNNEPPDEFLDYSDDEQEKAAKLKRKTKNHVHEANEEDEVQIIPTKISNNNRTSGNNFSRKSNTFEARNKQNSSHNRFRKDISPWIDRPPPYSETRPLPSQPVSVPVRKQRRPWNKKQFSSQTPNSPRKLLLSPKLPYLPRQPPNIRSPRPLLDHRSPPPINNTFHPAFSSKPQFTPNSSLRFPQQESRPSSFDIRSQPHIFGQVPRLGLKSSAPNMPLTGLDRPMLNPSPPAFSTTPPPPLNQSFSAYNQLPTELNQNSFGYNPSTSVYPMQPDIPSHYVSNPPPFNPNPHVFNPNPPVFNPNPPVFNPNPPVFDPNPPVFNPNPHVFNPNPPAFNHTGLVYSSNPPVHNPNTHMFFQSPPVLVTSSQVVSGSIMATQPPHVMSSNLCWPNSAQQILPFPNVQSPPPILGTPTFSPANGFPTQNNNSIPPPHFPSNGYSQQY